MGKINTNPNTNRFSKGFSKNYLGLDLVFPMAPHGPPC